jgi:hypothetical protein
LEQLKVKMPLVALQAGWKTGAFRLPGSRLYDQTRPGEIIGHAA